MKVADKASEEQKVEVVNEVVNSEVALIEDGTDGVELTITICGRYIQ